MREHVRVMVVGVGHQCPVSSWSVPSSSLPMNSMLAESCSSTYQSMCELQCQEGFNGTGGSSYVCDIDVLSDGIISDVDG